ncbi:MAG: mRNA surveillance protein pelota [Candidatus Bilamarchaeaceae archaeon]
MKIIHFDAKEGEIKVAADTVEDLWHLSKVIAAGDEVEGSTLRTYRVGSKEEKKHVTICLKTESVEFAEASNRLRILGVIIRGSPEEYVQIGRHHTIEVAPGDVIRIRKRWAQHELKRLRAAEKETKRPRLNIVVLDEEHALFATLKPYGIDYGAEIRNTARKREEDFEKKEREYFGRITAELERMEGKIIVAGPGFAKDNLKKFIEQKNPSLISRAIFESCSYAEPSGVNELLKRGVVEKVVGEARYEKEEKEVEYFFTEIYKETGRAVYGLDEVRKAVEMGAVSKLLVLDSLLRTSADVRTLVEEAEKKEADVIVISSEGDPGFRLKNFGGFGALLRWRLD